MVFADSPAFDMVVTSCLIAPLLTSESGKSPTCGFSQFFKMRSQSSTVLGATGLRFLERTSSSQQTACSRNVQAAFCCTSFYEVFDRVSAAIRDDLAGAACTFRVRALTDQRD